MLDVIRGFPKYHEDSIRNEEYVRISNRMI